jgi:cell shape-determining protein MreD
MGIIWDYHYHHPLGELSVLLILLMPYVADICRLLGLSIDYCWLGDMLMVYILMFII